MEDIIHLLPDSVANQIAAGEVVQRPSSIVKEMVENSIDAEATDIQVHVTDGGKTCVQIVDNGKGMSETDARMSFERHATSKISKAEDLFSLHTMGFRGEALASIAAVAQIELRTRRRGDELGTFLRISGSKIESQEPVACPEGTNFAVRNLFFNIPARRKFLKSNQTELSNIVSDFERIALVYPDISFLLTNNGADVHRLPAASVRQRIIDVFGRKINADLLGVDVETSIVSISGFVAKPESSRKKGCKQFFFVNGRYMRHPYFHSAVMHAYENLIPQGDHVSYFIYLSVDASTIDVNVHPTKTEIKFDNEQPIWQVLSAAVKESLGKYSNVPTIDFDVEDRPEIPVMGSDAAAPELPVASSGTYNPFATSSPRYNRPNTDWTKLYKGVQTFESKSNRPHEEYGSLVQPGEEVLIESLIHDAPKVQQKELWETSALDSSEQGGEDFSAVHTLPHFQYKGKYIVTPFDTGLLVVDQHRAHVRVLYDEYLRIMQNHRRASQGLLFPEVVQLTAAECIMIEQVMPQLEDVGFELTNLGGGSFSISGIPSGTEGLNPQQLLHDLLYAAIDYGAEHIGEELGHSIAYALAKASAIVYGQVLSPAETTHLLQQLFSLSTPMRTPDGKLVFNVVDHDFIEKMF